MFEETARPYEWPHWAQLLITKLLPRYLYVWEYTANLDTILYIVENLGTRLD